MHSMDNYYVSKLLPLIAEAKMSAIPNPLINMMLQGRHDTYPKRRGLTRIPELLEQGIAVALGQDCVLDPWYSMGTGDMLDVAHMAAHATQMGSAADKRILFAAVTEVPARVLGLDGYGIAPGCHADMVLLQARDPGEAIRLRPNRLKVIRRGKVIAEMAPERARLVLDGRPATVDPAEYAPKALS
jgi:cytosine deaminase